MNIPTGHQAVMPYLILADTTAFIAFTEKVFNAVLRAKHMRDDKTIMHAEIKIGDSTIMCGNATEEYKEQTANLFVYVDHADEALEKAKAAGATVIKELSDEEYGRTCGIADPAGNVWWITSVN